MHFWIEPERKFKKKKKKKNQIKKKKKKKKNENFCNRIPFILLKTPLRSNRVGASRLAQ
jgi:hypothetical protein